MIICIALNVVNAIDVTFVKDKDKISTTMKILNMIFSPIWPICTLFLTSITTYFTLELYNGLHSTVVHWHLRLLVRCDDAFEI